MQTTNPEICLDANVFIASLSPAEESHAACFNLLEKLRCMDYVFYEPALVIYEVPSAFRKKIRQEEISSDQAKHALGLFFALPILLQWQESLVNSALRDASAMNMPNIYDMSYLSVAKARGLPCVTLDREFVRKGSKLHRDIFLPGECLALL